MRVKMKDTIKIMFIIFILISAVSCVAKYEYNSIDKLGNRFVSMINMGNKKGAIKMLMPGDEYLSDISLYGCGTC